MNGHMQSHEVTSYRFWQAVQRICRSCIALLLASVLAAAATGQSLRLVPQSGKGGLYSLAYSPVGHMLASGCHDGTIKLWDTVSGRQLRTIAPKFTEGVSSAGIASIAFSPDGLIVAGGTTNRRIWLWNVETGKEKGSLIGPVGTVRSMAFSPDGRILASSSENHTIQLWDVATGIQVRIMPGHMESVNSIAFSTDGKVLASGSADTTIKLWDVATGKELQSLIGHAASVDSIAFRPHSGTLASSSGDKTIRLWDTASGRELRKLDMAAPTVRAAPLITGIAFSPDGTVLAGGNYEKTILFWDVDSGKQTKTFAGHTAAVQSTAFSPDGHVLASGSDDETIRLWDTTTGKELKRLVGHTDVVSSLASSSEHNVLASVSGKSINLWSLNEGREEWTFSESKSIAKSIAFASKRNLLVSATGSEIKLWDATTGKLSQTFQSGANSLALSRDELLLASCTAGGTIKIWDTTSGKKLTSMQAKNGVRSLAFTSNGRVLVCNSDYETEFFDITTRRVRRSIADGAHGLNPVALTPDDEILITRSADGLPELWDARRGRALSKLDGNLSILSPLTFSTDGHYLMGESPTNEVRLWDFAARKSLLTLAGHTNDINGAVFLPDGRTVATASTDTTTKLWDIATGTELATLVSFDDGSWAVTNPEGRFDTSSLEGDVWLGWVSSDSPFTSLPIEIFTRDYYEPGLLAKVMRREKLAPVRKISDLNRSQPEVSLAASLEGDRCVVSITLGVGSSDLKRNDVLVAEQGIPQDLRLFLDGKLVAYEDGPVTLDGLGKWKKSYSMVLPHNGEKEVELSAYCFNQDRVKSQTQKQNLAVDIPKVQGRAYVISVGVDHYLRSDLKLKFAAADAKAISSALKDKLAGYSEVVPIVLVSDESHHDATKARFHAVVDALAGKKADLTGVVNGERVAKATPEDLVIFSWSGHGLSSATGSFYLLPEDVLNEPNSLAPAFLASCISSEELSSWLRDLSPADMAFIVDSCHSAAAVQTGDFKPGPLGNRGLGQLAYDKGIRILAATQSGDVALESGRLGSGLLTYALVHDGLAAGKTPTLKEWLAAAVDDVPKLYLALEKGILRAVSATEITDPKPLERDFLQRPALFDYTRRPSPVPFIGKAP